MTAEQTTRKHRIGAEAIFSTFGANILIQVCTIFQGVMLARLLGPVGRGEFAAVILWPSLFAAVGLFGIGTSLARRAAAEPDHDALTRSGLVLGVGFASCTSLLCYLMLPLLLKGHNADLVLMSKWFVLFIFFNHLTLVFTSIDQGGGNFRRFNWTRVILNPIYLALVTLLWLAGVRRVFPFAVAMMAANAVVLAVRLAEFWRSGRMFGPFCPLKPIARDAFRYGLADLLSPLYQQVDKALFLYLLGVRELGFYTVALAASGVAGSLTLALASVTFGISAQSRGQEAFGRVAKVFRCSAWAWLVMGGVLALVMPVMLPLIFGKQFAPAIWPAILLIPGGVFAGQSSILEQSLRAQGRAFVGLGARFVGLVVMVPLAWLASKSWGMLGVPFAYDVAQLLCLVVFCIKTNAHFGQSTISALLPRYSDFRAMWSSMSHIFQTRFARVLKLNP
ncbi:MAG TPA: oligosaccharide flippase family protein [Candidatus Baltobacteraceae bacterium]|jgi:O-antigen/teichoic acid export membrane protein|nr:oligosaccharide flippase family protein [Candidatus Baltobacteraceae bacterium]